MVPVFKLSPERFDPVKFELIFEVSPDPSRAFMQTFTDLWRTQRGSQSSFTLGGIAVRFTGYRHLRAKVKGFSERLNGQPLADALCDALNGYAVDTDFKLAEDAARLAAEEERQQREAERARATLAAMCGDAP